MKKYRLVFLFLLVSSLFTYSTAQTLQSMGGAGADFGSSIVQTSDGGYALTGSTDSYNIGKDNIYVMKLDYTGKLQWTRTIKSSNVNYAYSIIQTRDGGYAVTGYTDSVSGAGKSNVYVIKLDADGNLKWTKTIGGANWDIGYSIFQTTDGGYAITGSTFSFHEGGNDIYVIRLDAKGNLMWTKTLGQEGNDIGCSIVQTTDGGYAIAGVTYSFGSGNGDVYVLKLDATGNLQWTKIIGGAGKDIGFSIIQTTDGGYAITGITYSYGAKNGDVYVIKLSADGSVKWTKAIGGSGTDQGASITQTSDRGYIITGSTDSIGSIYNYDIYVIKLDENGNLKWTKTIGGPGNDEGSSVVQTKSGGYVITGFTKSFTAGCYDAFLLKLDTSGRLSSNNNSASEANGGSTDSNNAENALKKHGILTNICTDLASSANVNPAPKSIEIYPNPCSGTLYLDIGTQSKLSGDTAEIKITDVTDRIILAQSITFDSRPMANTYTIDVSALKSGIYFISIHFEDKTEVKKFVKE